MTLLLLAGLALLAEPALGHGGLANYTVGDTWYRGCVHSHHDPHNTIPNPHNQTTDTQLTHHSYDPFTPATDQLNQPWMIQRQWSSIDPLFTPLSPYLACNNPGTPPPSYIPITAGANLTAVYWYWLHPYGPMTVWLAYCSDNNTDCADVDVSRVGWFKIWEAGLLDGNLVEGMWWQKQFQRWDGEPGLWPARVPKGLRRGLYMVRHEILSIHVGGKPQFYPECAHLNVTGGGEVVVPEEWLLRFPGGYKEDGEFLFWVLGWGWGLGLMAGRSVDYD